MFWELNAVSRQWEWYVRRSAQHSDVWRSVIFFGFMVLLCMALGTPVHALEQPRDQSDTAAKTVVIGNDRGGRIRARLREIRDIRNRGQRVEIRGRLCLSTCTMFLGLPDTCVSRTTWFGFHGPSDYGRQLDVREFDYWSEVIALHYPDQLRGWYMQTGRMRIVGYYRISGVELIRTGVKECDSV